MKTGIDGKSFDRDTISGYSADHHGFPSLLRDFLMLPVVAIGQEITGVITQPYSIQNQKCFGFNSTKVLESKVSYNHMYTHSSHRRLKKNMYYNNGQPLYTVN